MFAARTKTARKARNQAPSTRPEDERLGLGTAFTFGLQHVLTMYGGIIAPPLIIGAAAGLTPTEVGVLVAACLFMGGLATLLQTLGIPFFGSQLPLVQGVSFAGVATMLAIVNQGSGLPAVFGAVIVMSKVALSAGVLLLGSQVMLPTGWPRAVKPSLVSTQPSFEPSGSVCVTGAPE